MQAKTNASSSWFHWSQWICAGPERRFTSAEMERGGDQPWPSAIDTYVYSNVFVLLAINYRELPNGLAVYFSIAVLALTWFLLRVAKSLWLAPTRFRLNLITLLTVVAMIVAALAYKWLQTDEALRQEIRGPLIACVMGVLMGLVAWWFLTLYRAQQIEGRLRELDQQDRALVLARRLATAQIQPHFLFNTLASVQHWVDTQDPRAASTLRSFTAYLRATLPMFERESLSLTEELQIVRSYLEVMQARLGTRLQWQIEIGLGVDESLQLPPGLLLTLVENAIGHGIEPALRGGSITVTATSPVETQVLIEVRDDGAGLNSDAVDGLGLQNSRERLQQLYGERARLTLKPLTPGCSASLEIHAVEPKP
ncbi:histidine kinase [Paucibacter sp. B2R-40]|uniref:sensor histidine kinase n=1 Tax=Paucibacter sp. B2R-40 TaxID=2893554 RepID=UPI0021E4772C|nr:histidine kinase [Paucibacter sp. B2R-40]MCV2353640.1 histidine kinase [Paucibacter sp. B2R-40]